MRLHPATRLLTLLMAVLLVGALAVPADGKRKRPRRYTENRVYVLMDWTICPTGATLMIGKGIGDGEGPSPGAEPDPDDNNWPYVDITASLPGSRGSITYSYPLNDVRDYAIWAGWIAFLPGLDEVVTDEPPGATPLDKDENPVPSKDNAGRPIAIVIGNQRIPVEDFMKDPIVPLDKDGKPAVPYNPDTWNPTAVLDVEGVREGEGDGVIDGTKIELGVDWITHQAGFHPEDPRSEDNPPVELVWKDRVDEGKSILLSLGQGGGSARYEVVSCPEGGKPDDSSPGVKAPGPSLTTEEIRDLPDQIDENRQVGRGPGGSLVPRPECTIVGTPGDDRIEGTPGNDVICGLGGKDVIDGDRGIDLIDGADGNDTLRGGPGNDLHLLGLRGDDRLDGNSGGDRASGGAGIDRVRGSSGNDPLLSGGWGADRLSGGQGRDRIRGGSGRDRIGARDRTRDRVDGGSGWDRARVDVLGSKARVPRRADRVLRVERLL
jgi:Ca2+-binding RTX toxin-like protein